MTMPREQRTTALPIATVVPAADVSRGHRMAGAVAKQTGDVLAEGLTSIGDFLHEEAERVATDTARENAATVPLQRDGEGRLQPPDLSRSFFSTQAQDAYRAVLANRYANEFLLDNTAALAELRAQHPNDPEGFRRSAESWTTGLLSTMPAAVRPQVEAAISRHAAAHFNSLWEARFRADQAEAGRRATDTAALIGRDLYDSLRAGNADAEPALRASLDATLTNAVAAGTLRPEQAEEQRRRYAVALPALAAVQRAAGGADPIAHAMRLITRAESGAQGDAAANPGSSARGRLQITDGLWRDYAPRLGLTDAERTDGPSQERVFRAFAEDVTPALREALGEAPGPGDYYAAWFLGRGAGLAFLRAAPDADARATYAAAAGERLAAQAFTRNGALLRDGMTVGQVLDGVRARVGQARAGSAEGFAQAAAALEAGPSAPGWRPEFDAFTLEERSQWAGTFRAAAGRERAEADRARTERHAALTREAIALRIEANQPGTQPERQAQIQTRLEDISRATGSDAALWNLREQAQRARQEGADAARAERVADAIEDGLRRIAALAPSPTGANGEADLPPEVYGRLAGASPAAQARILSDMAREAERRARAAALAAPALREVEQALATNQPMEGTPAQQQVMAALAGEDLSAPAALPAVLAGAALGVLPAGLSEAMARAVRGRDAVAAQGFAQMHAALMRDPAARPAYRAAVPAPLREAWGDLSALLPHLPPEGRAARIQGFLDAQARPARRQVPEGAR